MLINLTSADLRGADLRNTYMQSAILKNAKLQGADLSGADLCRANLEKTDLRSMNLESVEFYQTKFCCALLPDNVIFIEGMQHEVMIVNGFLRIGSQQHPIKAWEDFSDDDIKTMYESILSFWQANKRKLLGIAKLMTD